jgi:hypothetical protein
MTREEILRATQNNFEEFFAIWTEHMDHKGLGALVFSSGDELPSDQPYQCAYLTLGELRDFLKRISTNDGFVYRWVKQAKSFRGIPILIIPPDLQERRELFFSSVRNRS